MSVFALVHGSCQGAWVSDMVLLASAIPKPGSRLVDRFRGEERDVFQADEIPGGHGPFLSRPFLLARELSRLATREAA